jgi:hypothetical protein
MLACGLPLRRATLRVYNFVRGLEGELKPGYVFSDDAGKSWTRGGVFIDVPNYSGMQHRPYVKIATDGQTRVHFVFTEGHPRNNNNSIHHLMYEDGYLLSTNGSRIAPLSTGIHDPASTASLVFHGDGDHVAWTSDLHLDKLGRPVGVFSVRRKNMGAKQGSADEAPTRQGTVADDTGTDIRYHYARWNGTTWSQHNIAHGGSGLYAKEADYSGNIALDPQEVDTVYFSTNVHPASDRRDERGRRESWRRRSCCPYQRVLRVSGGNGGGIGLGEARATPAVLSFRPTTASSTLLFHCGRHPGGWAVPGGGRAEGAVAH